jgi:5'-3' exonuclease
MGIKNLHKFLKKHTEQSYKETHLSVLSGKRIAIDSNIYLYKFKGCARESWLTMFTTFALKFRKYKIDCVYIYDTKAPIEKNAKKEERKQRKKNAENRITNIKNAVQEYDETGKANDLLHEICAKPQQRLLQINSYSPLISKETIDKEIANLEGQIINISKYDIELSKRALELMGIPYYDSQTEAETLCSYLCCHQVVDAVLSDDTDVLVYGTPLFLTKFNMKSDICIELNFMDLLNQLQLTKEQFIDLCILSGTDYNDNIPNIGNEKAYKLIQKYKSIESIEEEKHLDTSMLNYRKVRELFSVPSEFQLSDYSTYQRAPNLEDLINFFQTHNIRIPESRLWSVFG